MWTGEPGGTGIYWGLKEQGAGTPDVFPALIAGDAQYDNLGVVLGDAVGGDSDYIFQYEGSIYFFSDGETVGPPSPPDGIRWVATLGETGNWQDAGKYLGRVDGGLMVASDVPEPSTWALMALGFAGLGFTGARKARRAPAIA